MPWTPPGDWALHENIITASEDTADYLTALTPLHEIPVTQSSGGYDDQTAQLMMPTPADTDSSTSAQRDSASSRTGSTGPLEPSSTEDPSVSSTSQ